MLKIQVLGKGMIPRGLGLAPRKEFFKADLNTIYAILVTPGLKVNMLNPENGSIVPVTTTNLKKLWDKYRSDKIVESKVNTAETKAVSESSNEKVAIVAPVLEPDAKENKEIETSKVEVDKTTEVSSEVMKEAEEAVLADKEEKAEEVKVEQKSEAAPVTIKPVMNPENGANNNTNNSKGNNNNHHNGNNNHKK